MNSLNPENIVQASLPQEKVATNSSQNEVDPNLSQKDSAIKESKSAESIESTEDPDWRAFREARKRDRAERQAAEQRAAEKEAEAAALRAAMEAAFSKQTYQNDNRYDNHNDRQEESEDERIEKKVQAALAAREAEYQRKRDDRERQEYPQRLQKTYADFNQVISQENLDYLDYHYPEISRPLQRLNDDYEKWSDIYLAVKKFVPNQANAKKESARADANFSKPKSLSMQSITQPGPSSNSHILTAEKRAANWERMQRSLRGLSNG